ncbi:unnamed protein product, partial [Scytosiphon promiscuus]
MYQLLLKVFLRKVRQNKLFYLINFILLITGILSYNFLWSFIIHELDFDQFHENAENIYRIQNDRYNDEVLLAKDVLTYPATGAFLENQFPEVKTSIRLHSFPITISYNGQEFSEKNFYYSDPEFFQFFSFPLLSGNRET